MLLSAAVSPGHRPWASSILIRGASPAAGPCQQHQSVAGYAYSICHALPRFSAYTAATVIDRHVSRCCCCWGACVAGFCAVHAKGLELPAPFSCTDFFVKPPRSDACFAVCTTIASQRGQNPRRWTWWRLLLFLSSRRCSGRLYTSLRTPDGPLAGRAAAIRFGLGPCAKYGARILSSDSAFWR